MREGASLSRFLVGIALALVPLLSMPAPAGAQQPSNEVKADYLYNFGKFVRWPQSAHRGPLVICVTGQDEALAQAIRHMAAADKVKGRSVEVRPIQVSEQAEGCTILYVGAADPVVEDDYVAGTSGKPVLTVGDGADFVARGGIIQFLVVDGHMRFSVNLNAAGRNGLTVSSELLKVAVAVIGRPEGGGAP